MARDLTILRAEGSMWAHDDLVVAWANWKLKQQACEAMPDDAEGAMAADVAWALLGRHAINCGYHQRLGDLAPWAAKAICNWARICGVDPVDVPGIQFGRA